MLDGNGTVELAVPSPSIKCTCAPRDQARHLPEEGMVYVLIGDVGNLFYVGQTNGRDGDRIRNHEAWTWWNRVVVFHGNPRFNGNSNKGVREHFEHLVFEKFKALGNGWNIIVKTAGNPSEYHDDGSERRIWEDIQTCCRALFLPPFCNPIQQTRLSLVISTSEIVEEQVRVDGEDEEMPTQQSTPQFRDGSPVPENWNATPKKVADTIAKWFHHGAGGLYLILCRKRKVGDKLKTALEAFGIPVVDGYVPTRGSWQSAHLPSPN